MKQQKYSAAKSLFQLQNLNIQLVIMSGSLISE